MKRDIHVGPLGGRYYFTDKGFKVYIKDGTSRKKSPTKAKSAKSPKRVKSKDLSPKPLSNRQKSSATRGWGDVKPHSRPERQALFDRCPECFLKPETKQFPVCNKKSTDCIPDCRGIVAAKIRANQWKYMDVAKKAENLNQQYQCTKKVKSTKK